MDRIFDKDQLPKRVWIVLEEPIRHLFFKTRIILIEYNQEETLEFLKKKLPN